MEFFQSLQYCKPTLLLIVVVLMLHLISYQVQQTEASSRLLISSDYQSQPLLHARGWLSYSAHHRQDTTPLAMPPPYHPTRGSAFTYPPTNFDGWSRWPRWRPYPHYIGRHGHGPPATLHVNAPPPSEISSHAHATPPSTTLSSLPPASSPAPQLALHNSMSPAPPATSTAMPPPPSSVSKDPPIAAPMASVARAPPPSEISSHEHATPPSTTLSSLPPASSPAPELALQNAMSPAPPATTTGMLPPLSSVAKDPPIAAPMASVAHAPPPSEISSHEHATPPSTTLSSLPPASSPAPELMLHNSMSPAPLASTTTMPPPPSSVGKDPIIAAPMASVAHAPAPTPISTQFESKPPPPLPSILPPANAAPPTAPSSQPTALAPVALGKTNSVAPSPSTITPAPLHQSTPPPTVLIAAPFSSPPLNTDSPSISPAASLTSSPPISSADEHRHAISPSPTNSQFENIPIEAPAPHSSRVPALAPAPSDPDSSSPVVHLLAPTSPPPSLAMPPQARPPSALRPTSSTASDSPMQSNNDAAAPTPMHMSGEFSPASPSPSPSALVLTHDSPFTAPSAGVSLSPSSLNDGAAPDSSMPPAATPVSHFEATTPVSPSSGELHALPPSAAISPTVNEHPSPAVHSNVPTASGLLSPADAPITGAFSPASTPTPNFQSDPAPSPSPLALSSSTPSFAPSTSATGSTFPAADAPTDVADQSHKSSGNARAPSPLSINTDPQELLVPASSPTPSAPTFDPVPAPSSSFQGESPAPSISSRPGATARPPLNGVHAPTHAKAPCHDYAHPHELEASTSPDMAPTPAFQ